MKTDVPDNSRGAWRPAEAVRPRSIPLRTMALLTVLILGVLIWVSGSDSYEENLTKVALRHAVSPRLFQLVEDSPELQALALDVSGDQELAFKMQWALEKHGADAGDVLVRFGDLPDFQENLRRYGESIVPVLAYFVRTDIATLRASSFFTNMLVRWREWMLNWFRKVPEPSLDMPDYGPQMRAESALDAITAKGHQFLGQFVVNSHTGKVERLQSERVFDGMKDFFFSSIQDLERRHAEREKIRAQDLAWAGADLLGLFGGTKALKLLKSTRNAEKAVKELSLPQRTGLIAGPLMRSPWRSVR